MSEMIAALVEVQKELKHAELDAENPHFQSKYASLKSIIDAVKPALNEHGFAFIQRSNPTEGGVQVETILFHSSGDHISGGVVFVPADKQNAHGFGSSLTYAKRYSLALTCGIGADPDDDGNASVHDLLEYNQHVREHWTSINAIKVNIHNALHNEQIGDTSGMEDCYREALEAYQELTDTQKRSLWVAPTKGGIFTTDERRIIKEVLPRYLERG